MKIIMITLLALLFLAPVKLPEESKEEKENWHKETVISIVVPYDEIEIQYIPLSLISQ